MTLLGKSPVGLTREGAEEIVTSTCNFEGLRRGRAKSLLSVRDMYCHLIAHGSATGEELLTHFRPADPTDLDHGAYGRHSDREWFSDVGAPALAGLPGVETPSGNLASVQGEWAFETLPSSVNVDEADILALEEHRETPETRVMVALDDLGVNPRSDEREALTLLHARFRSAVGEMRDDDLEAALRGGVALEDVESTLEKLPGVSRKVRNPDPADIDVETMADVLKGRELLDEAPFAVWRFGVDEE